MVKVKLLVLTLLLMFNGCGNSAENGISNDEASEVTVVTTTQVEIEEEQITSDDILVCIEPEYDTKFKGRIVYDDGKPYKNGAIKVVGATWINMGMTDENGYFEIGVKGDERYFFSAYSPYGDFVYYPFDIPLIVPMYDTGYSYECQYGIEISECYENGILIG